MDALYRNGIKENISKNISGFIRVVAQKLYKFTIEK